MKVIAEAGNGKFICEISEREIQKFLNIFYKKNGILKIGKEFDLSKGYEFSEKIKKILESSIKENQKLIKDL